MNKRRYLVVALLTGACYIQPSNPPPAGPQPQAVEPNEPQPQPVGVAPAAQPVGMHAMQPFTCAGQQSVIVENAVIDNPQGDAINAQGQCQVVIRNSRITAHGVGIVASGQAEIQIVSSSVLGQQASVSVTGQAQIDATGSTFQGQVFHSGMGQFVDHGGAAPPAGGATTY